MPPRRGLHRTGPGVIRIGIIGLDTSHSTAFTELLNGTSDDPLVREFEVVAAYPHGSTAIRSSRDRIPGYIETVKKFGVEITASVAELLDKVDCVLLETNDGRLHLGQAVEVFRSGKICYIDKPLGATLGEAHRHLRDGRTLRCERLHLFGSALFAAECGAASRRLRQDPGCRLLFAPYGRADASRFRILRHPRRGDALHAAGYGL